MFSKSTIFSSQLHSIFIRFFRLKGSVEDFGRLMKELLAAIADLMRLKTDHSIVCQGAGLRYLPSCVSDIAQAYDVRDLA